MQRVILTVIGSDRPGLTGALAEAVLAAGGNWLESHLSRLGGKYVGSVLVELPAEAVEKLEAAAAKVDAAGLKVAIVAAGEDGAAGTPLALSLVGQDRPGIVREVTTALGAIGVNIERFQSDTEQSAWSGAPLFKAEAELRLPASTSEDDVQAALEAISGEIMVDIKVSAPA